MGNKYTASRTRATGDAHGFFQDSPISARGSLRLGDQSSVVNECLMSPNGDGLSTIETSYDRTFRGEVLQILEVVMVLS